MEIAKKILFVEDEEHLRNVISLNLDLEGYSVTGAASGEDAIAKFSKEKFDLILLDVMLPEIDGYAVCEHIRLKDKNVGIMFLSARSSTEERKRGLKLGADDYLAKPFDLEELLLRVKRLISRSYIEKSIEIDEKFKIGNGLVDFRSYTVDSSSGETREMSQKEALFLKLLISRKNEAVTRNEILEVVWGKENLPSTRAIDNFIVQFRKDFEENPKKPIHFKSIHGVGYRLTF